MELHKLIRYTFLFASIGTLAACSSADTGTATTPAAPTPVTVTGSVFASNVNGATVTVKDGSGKTVATETTKADGTYSVDMLNTDLTSDLIFESTGGIFDDEATGAGGVGTSAGAMSAFVTGGTLASGDSVHVTPGTTITADLATNHNRTQTQASTDFSSAFGYNPNISVQPVDITTDAALSASDESRFSGFYAATFSQLANNVGLTADQQFSMFSDMAKDLADGKLDGLDSLNNPVTIGTSANILTDYIDTVGSYKTAETQTYKVTYIPSSMMTFHGKAQFQISVTDKNDIPVPNLVTSGDLKVMPMMYMNAGHKHATPKGEITESGTDGTYDVTIYYVMASRMGAMENFRAMGTWDLKVMIGMESVHFYPNIMMAMGDTVVTQLKAQNTGTDTVINMDGLEESRTYLIFREDLDLSGTATDATFEMFLATRDTMMDFPVVDEGETLDSVAGPITLSTVDVQVSTDGTTFNSASNPNNSTGYFSRPNMDISAGKIYVKLTVDGELKTTNGLPADNSTDPDDTNMHAVFTVTP